MKLYIKTLLITGVTLVCLIAILYLASSSILMSGFAKVEQEDTKKNVQRATMAFSDDISALDRVVGDWAGWDETYAFIQGEDPYYIERNAPNATFIEFDLNLMLFVNSSGEIVYARGFDPKTEEELPVSVSLKELPADNILFKHTDKYAGVKGIILLPEGPMIIVSRPILDNERKKPILGSMIWGRYLEEHQIQQLANITHLSLAFYRYDNMPADLNAVRDSFTENEPILVKTLDEQKIGGYTLLKDIYGNPALLLGVEIPRAIHNQGKATIHYFILSLLLVGFWFGSMNILLLDKSVLSRVAILSNNVSKIGRNSKLGERVNITGNDELKSLAEDINGMLESIEQSQKKLSRSEEKNQALVDAIPDLILQIGKDGTILSCKLTKSVPAFDISGKNIYDLIPESTEQIAFYFNRTFQTGNIQIFEFEPYKNGDKYCYEARLVPSGKDEVIAIVRDITERKQTEIKLKETLKELTATNAELEQFIHLSAHDLQEPLRMIACYVQMLEKRYKEKLDPEADEMIFYAADGAKNMSKKLNDLLVYSSLNKYVKPLEPTDCEAVLEHTLSNLTVAITESCANVSYDPMPRVIADETQLVHIFQNLIENAIKFRSIAPPEIHISAEQKGSEWVFSVRDNGIGIDPQFFDRIFNIFHRLHPRGKYPGTGIGLAICKKIVERHGGRIWVESELGKGSTFYFSIPGGDQAKYE